MADLNILDIAQLGARLSSSLDLQTETYHEARQNGIPNLLSLIYSTSSTLRKLHELSQQTPDAFTEVCKNDINGLANACRVLYEGILVLLVHRDEQHDENKEIGRLSNERVECLLSSLTNKTFSNYKTWQWLSLRLKVCQQELRTVKFELTLRFLLGSIAQFQSSTTTRSPGDWERERSIRVSAESIAKRRVAYHKKCKKNRERWTNEITFSSTTTPIGEEIDLTVALSPDENKTEDVGKDVNSKVSNVSDTIVPTPGDTEDDTTTSSDTTSYLGTPSKNWFQRLFSRTSCDEWWYEDIEAYTLHIRHGKQHVAKLPLEEKEIITTLRKLTTKHFWNRRPSLMEQYDSFDQTVRQDIDEAISIAKRKNNRDMTLIAMSARKTASSAGIDNKVPYTSELSFTLFFKLGETYEPIYVVDRDDKKWTIPYTACETVQMLRDQLPAHGQPVLGRPPGQAYCNYTICTENKTPVTSETWDSVRRPGMILRLDYKGYLPPIPPLPMPAPMPVPPVMVTPPGFRPPGLPRPLSIYEMPHIPNMRDIYQEMDDLLKLSDSWTPDEETIEHAGLGNLFRLWTNAIDPEAQEEDSDWSGRSCYSVEESCGWTNDFY
ncbi:hypothetical protein FPSE5266_02398 [Fusarium pseudograminearum]|nr:hypothetical protein FPSE5266_02398 [Fusarium pseudograminearum]